MRKRFILAALMCVLIPLASYAIPITNLDNTDGYSSGAQVYIILSKGFSINPPSSNPPILTADKPSEPGSNKTSKTTMPSYTKPPVQPDTQLTPEEYETIPNGPPVGGGETQPPAAPVPEPATMLLLGAGLVGVATLRKMF